MLKNKNFNKPKKTSTSVALTAKKGSSKSNYKLFDFNKLEDIRCRECGGIGYIQAQCANSLMKNKAMQSTWSDDDYKDSIDEEDFVGGLVVHNDVSKYTNDSEQESNIRDAYISKASHLAPCKEDINSRLGTVAQHVNKNNDLDSDVSDIDINNKKTFHESYKMMFAK